MPILSLFYSFSRPPWTRYTMFKIHENFTKISQMAHSKLMVRVQTHGRLTANAQCELILWFCCELDEWPHNELVVSFNVSSEWVNSELKYFTGKSQQCRSAMKLDCAHCLVLTIYMSSHQCLFSYRRQASVSRKTGAPYTLVLKRLCHKTCNEIFRSPMAQLKNRLPPQIYVPMRAECQSGPQYYHAIQSSKDTSWETPHKTAVFF